jgi:hypothetical protein
MESVLAYFQKAMARYYGEEDVVHDKHVKPHFKMTQAERLLCREFWHGQLHGSGDKAPIHARHMRSRFFLIPRGRFKSSSGYISLSPSLLTGVIGVYQIHLRL